LELMEHESELLREPLFAGATVSLDHRHNHRGSWIFDIPFEPQPQYAAKWREEQASLMQIHDDYISNSMDNQQQRGTFMLETGFASRVSTKKVWPAKECLTGDWKYDHSGKHHCEFFKWPWKCWYTPGWKKFKDGQCEFGNNIWHLFNWWCPKSKNILWKEDLHMVARCFDDENWADQLLKVLDITPAIDKLVRSITGCFDELEGDDAKWRLDKILAFYGKYAWNPVELIKRLDSEYLAPTIADLNPWFQRTVQGMMKKGRALLDNILDGNQSYDMDWANGVVEDGWQNFANETTGLVSVNGLGALRCLKRQFGVWIYQASKPHIAGMVLNIVKPAAQFLAGVLNTLEKWFQDKVSEAMNGDDWFAQLGKMIRSAILKTCLDKYRKIDIHNLAQANPKIDLTTVGEYLVAPFFEKVKLWSLHHVVDPLAHALSKASKEVAHMIMHGVDALAGLIPFWGGLVGTLLSSAGAVGKQIEATFSRKSIIGGFEAVFKWLTDEIVKIVRGGLAQMKAALMSNPIGKIVIHLIDATITAVGGPLTQQCQDSIEKLAKLKNISAEELKKLKDMLMTTSTTTGKPKPTPRPTPRPTPKPTPKPTPHPPFMSHCYKDETCRAKRMKTYAPGFRRRDWGEVWPNNDPDWIGRDDCIEAECNGKGLTWNQNNWVDCGKATGKAEMAWHFSGWCDKPCKINDWHDWWPQEGDKSWPNKCQQDGNSCAQCKNCHGAIDGRRRDNVKEWVYC